jgi:hypothetical protein
MFVVACAPATLSSTRGEMQLAPTVLSKNPTVLSRAEWADANVSTAFEAVEHLRPQFFNRRGETSILLRRATVLSVYLDNVRLGGVETLRDVPITAIQSIRYLSPGEATYRWGTNQTGGAILLSSH